MTTTAVTESKARTVIFASLCRNYACPKRVVPTLYQGHAQNRMNTEQSTPLPLQIDQKPVPIGQQRWAKQWQWQDGNKHACCTPFTLRENIYDNCPGSGYCW
jgi:hypothetical protein